MNITLPGGCGLTASAVAPSLLCRSSTPILFDEPPLAALQPAMRGQRLPRLLESLLQAGSAAERQRQVSAIVHAMGFEWLGYGSVDVQGDRPVPVSFRVAHGDGAWQRRYVAEHYHEVDPRLRMALRSSLPWVWHIDELPQLAERPHDRRTQRFVQDLRDTGMHSGVMLALASPRPHERTLISLLSREPLPEADDALFSRVLTLGLCLQEYYTHYAPPAADPAPAVTLSATQRAILQCLAHGLADKQIADRLDLSPHAVDYHMRQLRKRFGARNRMQLVPQGLRQLDGA